MNTLPKLAPVQLMVIAHAWPADRGYGAQTPRARVGRGSTRSRGSLAQLRLFPTSRWSSLLRWRV